MENSKIIYNLIEKGAHEDVIKLLKDAQFVIDPAFRSGSLSVTGQESGRHTLLTRLSFTWLTRKPKIQDIAAIVDLLIARGVDVNAQCGEGVPALLRSLWCDGLRELIVPSLVRVPGIDLEAMDDSKHTALGFAIMSAFVDIAHMLMEKHVDVSDSRIVLNAVFYDQFSNEYIMRLIQRGGDVNPPISHGKSLLEYVFIFHDWDLTQEFIKLISIGRLDWIPDLQSRSTFFTIAHVDDACARWSAYHSAGNALLFAQLPIRDIVSLIDDYLPWQKIF